jgi:hypothetical protein
MPFGILMKVVEIASCAPPSLFFGHRRTPKNKSAPAKTGELSKEG